MAGPHYSEKDSIKKGITGVSLSWAVAPDTKTLPGVSLKRVLVLEVSRGILQLPSTTRWILQLLDP